MLADLHFKSKFSYNNCSKIALQIVVLIVVMTICPAKLFSQTGVLRGVVKDKKTEVLIMGAAITVDSTVFGAVSDTDGTFIIRDIPSKSYNLHVQSIGYEPATIFNVVVSSGNQQMLNIELEGNKSVYLN